MFYDIVVLGAGPGGYVSAIRASQLGAKVAIIENEKIGGTCLNTGCIPTKSLLKNVEILHGIEIGKRQGINISEIELDYSKAVKAKNKVVRQLIGGIEKLLKSNNIDIYEGLGIVKGMNKIVIEDVQMNRKTIEYGKLIIATGSVPAIPPVKGINEPGIMTSEEMLNLENLPEEVIIVGGGIIGCEFATIFNAYGCKVTIIEKLSSLVDMLDADISNFMNEHLSGQGIKLKLGCFVEEISKDKKGIFTVKIIDSHDQQELLETKAVLISTGRKANLNGIEGLNLSMEKGYIKVSDYLETNISNIYAIGDVTGKKLLAHVASEMGAVAAENALGKKKKMNFAIIPSCIYTIPEIATVGLSEMEAHEKGIDIEVGKFPLMASGKAIATGETEGMFKIIAEKESKKILGAHLIGKSATEIIAEITAYIKMGASTNDIITTIHAHPTFSESVAEAARDTNSCCIHMPKM